MDLGGSLDIFPLLAPPSLATLPAMRLGRVSVVWTVSLCTLTCSVLSYLTAEEVIGDFRHKSLEILLYWG